MKKILLFLVALVATLSMNAQTTEIYNASGKVAAYLGADVNVKFGMDGSDPTIMVYKGDVWQKTYKGSEYKVVSTPVEEAFKAVYNTNGGDNTLTFYYDAVDHSGNGITVYDNLPTAATKAADWGYNSIRADVKEVVIDASVKNYSSLTSTAYMFKGMATATNISGAEYLDVSNVTDMSYMFSNFGGGTSSSPTTLNVVPDVSKWNTGNVTNMNAMFESYGNFSSSLDKVPDVSDWNTGKVANMAYMFQKYGYGSQTFNAVPDVSKWNTGNVTSMNQMFFGYGYNSTALNAVPNVSNWNTGKAENMYQMFIGYGYNSTALNTVPNVSNWNTGNVTNMNGMFNGYGYTSTALNTVPNVSNWNTGNVTNMYGMFMWYGYNSTALNTVPNVSNWNTDKVTDMSGMFYGYGHTSTNISCVLDLSGWDLSKIKEDKGKDVFGFKPKTFDVTIPAKTGKKSNESGKWYYGDGTNHIAPPTGKTFTFPAAEPEYVEIGGLKWATMNLGAEKETDYGDYFAWGEKAPYYEGTGGWPATLTWKSGKASGYAWQSYCGGSSFTEWSNPPYDATTKILKPEFDAAAQILGNGWRMPTSAEFKALYDACLNGSYDTETNPSGASAKVGKGVYWCTNYDGVKGLLFCDGTNKLFFPAAGYGAGIGHNSAGSQCRYWSSSLNSGNGAYYLSYSSSDGVNPQKNFTRYGGFSVRPVKDAATPLPDGALAGEFSVSATKKVHFSQGNLVATINATGAPTAWKFHEHQCDTLGCGGANKNIGATAGDVDFFGWSTSTNGGTSTTNNYGIKTSDTNSDYSGDFYDWGKAVGDGNTWRTLSKDEWTYLFNNHSKKWATVNGVKGYVIAPDGFDGTLSSTYADDAALAANNLVFLPAAGYRVISSVFSVGEYGSYWSSTAYGDYAYDMFLYRTGVIPDKDGNRYGGYSVRLVTEIK